MAMHLLVLGLIAAVSGVLAIVANQRIEPFYSYILRSIPQIQVNFVPRVRALYSARKAIANNGTLRIRDGYMEELQTVHDILVEEYEFDEQYYPIHLKFYHNSIEIGYAEGRTNGRRNVTQDDVLSLMDSRISDAIGRVAAYAGILCVVAFALLIVLAVI